MADSRKPCTSYSWLCKRGFWACSNLFFNCKVPLESSASGLVDYQRRKKGEDAMAKQGLSIRIYFGNWVRIGEMITWKLKQLIWFGKASEMISFYFV